MENDTKKLNIDIPESPFNVDDEDIIYPDDEFDDDEINEVDADTITDELERLKWKSEDEELYDYLERNSHNIEKSFYCYIVSQIGRDNLNSYMDGFRELIKDYVTDKEHKELPKEIKHDDVTMEFRKQTIERNADRLSNQIMTDLFQMMDMKD